MPTGANSDAKQTKVFTLLRGGDFVKDWTDRALHSKSRIIYVAGITCNAAWRRAEAEGMLNGFTRMAVGTGVFKYTSPPLPFFALADVPHPSAHLMSGGRPETRESFADAFAVVAFIPCGPLRHAMPASTLWPS
jgi:hypothetical protein